MLYIYRPVSRRDAGGTIKIIYFYIMFLPVKFTFLGNKELFVNKESVSEHQ